MLFNPPIVARLAACAMGEELPRRIIKESQKLKQDAPPGITADPVDDNLRHMKILMQGP